VRVCELSGAVRSQVLLTTSYMTSYMYMLRLTCICYVLHVYVSSYMYM